MTIASYLQKISTEIIQSLFEDDSLQADVQPCMQEEFGHYQCNSALQLAKLLSKPPREIANKIVSKIEEQYAEKTLFSKIEIAGPGFINFSLHPEFLAGSLEKMFKDTHLGIQRPEKIEKVIVEYSSPNIAKELHVGHLRSTIIGESLARIFSFLGHDVLRLNHIGDWGTQFGMLIAYIKEFAPKLLAGSEQITTEELMTYYRSAKRIFDEDENFKKKAHQEVVKLQAREEEAIHIWKKICHISRLAFQKIYDLLDVSIQERGESFYHPFLHDLIEELEEKKLITVSDGAKCIFMDGFSTKEGKPLPLIVQKSDGGFNYATTDLAAMKHRSLAEKADRIIVVVDLGQSLHFKMVYQAALLAGYIDPTKVQFNHVAFGLVLGADGKKFKTRSGETEKLIDLLETAITKAKEIIQEKDPEINLKNLDHLAQNIGIAAVKYADLSTQRQKDYSFSYEKMLQFEGNTAVFLLYAYVRIQGIKRKAEVNSASIAEHFDISLTEPAEISLAYHITRFGEVLDQITRDLMPNRLTDYLFHLAETFNQFFRDCRVVGSPQEKSRLALCEITGKVLKQGLYLLGIKCVERM